MYFKLLKRPIVKKVFIHTFGNASDFHPLNLLDCTAREVSLETFLLVPINSG